MSAATPMAVVPPVTTAKVRRRGAAASRSSVDVHPNKDDGVVTSPRRNNRKSRDVQASLPSLEASQKIHQSAAVQSDGKAAGSLQAQARIGERPMTSQTNLQQQQQQHHHQQQQQHSPWTARALDLYKNINGRLTLTPRRALPPPFSRRLSDDSAPTSIRTLARHPLVPWFLSLAIAAGLAGLYVSSFGGGRMPAQIGDQVLAENFADVRRQVKDVESKMEKIIKHMQAQVDVVDKSMRKSMEESMSEQRTWVEAELKKATASVETRVGLVASQMELLEVQVKKLLGRAPPLSDVEVTALVTKVVDLRAAAGNGRAISLDDVRAAARSIVMEELGRHVADGGASGPDYALRSGGGQVVAHSNAKWEFLGPLGMMKVLAGQRLHPMAQTIIEPKRGVAGECFPFRGSNGSVDIQLRGYILPTAVALEHVPQTVAFESTSAPREFAIYGWSSSAASREPILLGGFEYNIEGSAIQEFKLSPRVSSLSIPINMIRLHVTSNHGHAEHTCVYRLRVYGSGIVVNPNPQQAIDSAEGSAVAL